MNGFLLLIGVGGFFGLVIWANTDPRNSYDRPLKARVFSALWNCPLWATSDSIDTRSVSSSYSFGFKEAQAALLSGALPKNPTDEQIERYLTSRFRTNGNLIPEDPEMVVSSLNPEDIYYPFDGIDMGGTAQ